MNKTMEIIEILNKMIENLKLKQKSSNSLEIQEEIDILSELKRRMHQRDIEDNMLKERLICEN